VLLLVVERELADDSDGDDSEDVDDDDSDDTEDDDCGEELEELVDDSSHEDEEDGLEALETELEDWLEDELLSRCGTSSDEIATILAHSWATSSGGITAVAGYGHGLLPALSGVSVLP